VKGGLIQLAGKPACNCSGRINGREHGLQRTQGTTATAVNPDQWHRAIGQPEQLSSGRKGNVHKKQDKHSGQHTGDPKTTGPRQIWVSGHVPARPFTRNVIHGA
jgi:hypothetical protein